MVGALNPPPFISATAETPTANWRGLRPFHWERKRTTNKASVFRQKKTVACSPFRLPKGVQCQGLAPGNFRDVTVLAVILRHNNGRVILQSENQPLSKQPNHQLIPLHFDSQLLRVRPRLSWFLHR